MEKVVTNMVLNAKDALRYVALSIASDYVLGEHENGDISELQMVSSTLASLHDIRSITCWL